MKESIGKPAWEMWGARHLTTSGTLIPGQRGPGGQDDSPQTPMAARHQGQSSGSADSVALSSHQTFQQRADSIALHLATSTPRDRPASTQGWLWGHPPATGRRNGPREIRARGIAPQGQGFRGRWARGLCLRGNDPWQASPRQATGVVNATTLQSPGLRCLDGGNPCPLLSVTGSLELRASFPKYLPFTC